MSESVKAGSLASGLLLFPVFHQFMPGYDLLCTGIVGGLIAFGFHRKHGETKEKAL